MSFKGSNGSGEHTKLQGMAVLSVINNVKERGTQCEDLRCNLVEGAARIRKASEGQDTP